MRIGDLYHGRRMCPITEVKHLRYPPLPMIFPIPYHSSGASHEQILFRYHRIEETELNCFIDK